MQHAPLALFGLNATRELALLVAHRLEVELGPHEEREFEDGEHKARPLQDVRGHDVFVLHALHGDNDQSANDKLCRLLFFCGAVRDAGAARVTAVVPYLCYARKDRRTKPHDPIATRYVAALFEAVGIDRVIVSEVHNLAAFENAFRCPVWHIDSAPLIAEHFASQAHAEPMVVVSPDAGGAKRAEQFRQELEHQAGREIGNAIIEKFRSGGVVSGGLLAGDVRGKTVVVIDDLISTGGTLLRAATTCRAAGAAKVMAAATHGLFIGGAEELFAAPSIDGIVVANTVPPFRAPRSVAAARLTVLDASESIARAIAVCHEGR